MTDPQRLSRRDIATEFLRAATSGHVREAYALHVSDDFKHHNPWFAAGRVSLMNAMEQNSRDNPDKRYEALNVLEDDELVAVHGRVLRNENDRGIAVVHIFRFQGDKIVELLDVGLPVPDQVINTDGMF
jgi:predicted SnoaL-like aldol condensation-catalyzing enzyme